MATRIEQIREAVEEHFTMKDMADAEHEMAMNNNWKDDTFRQYFINEHAKQHAAMTMLRALLPLLDAAIKIEQNDGKLPEFTWFSLLHTYKTEVANLIEVATDP